MIELNDKELRCLRQAYVGLNVYNTMPAACDALLDKGLLALKPIGGCEDVVAIVTPDGRRAMVAHSGREVI